MTIFRGKIRSLPAVMLGLTLCLIGPFLVPVTAMANQLTIACSASERLCNWLGDDEYGLRGIELNIEHMAPADVLTQLRARPDQSDIDLWWGAPGDMLMQAVDEGLLQRFEPANLDNQLRWSRQVWERSDGQAVGIFAGTLAIISNPIALVPANLPSPRCWSDLGDPQYRGQLLLEGPTESSNTFTFLSTVRHIFDQGQTERLIQEIQQNAQNGSANDSLRRVATGDRGITIALVHDAVLLYSFYSPLVVNVPCEGSGYVIGGAGISNSTNQFGPAAAFIEYTLSGDFQSAVVNDVSPQMFSNINAAPSEIYRNREYLNLVNHDAAGYFSSQDRAKVLELW